MFKTFRQRLLFWFLIFIGSSVLIILLSIFYIQQRERIFTTSEQIDASYSSLLKSVLVQQEFFSYETINDQFFKSGNSAYLDRYQLLFDSTIHFIQDAKGLAISAQFKLEGQLEAQEESLYEIDQLFKLLVEKVKERGFRDYNLEGDMRVEAHWLEEAREMPTNNLLSLRRHEKDYIIRNDQKYVDRFNQLVEQTTLALQKQSRIPKARKTEMLLHLKAYQQKFNQLVTLDREIGIKDNTALKQALDTKIHQLEAGFEQLVREAKVRKAQLFYRLNIWFGGFTILLMFISLVVSYWVSNRITQPLKELTMYITKFVDSNFTLESENPVAKTQDEIGKLTENFSVLKDEVINRLRFFKQKVDERTEELASANEQLVRLNEANSRFVPRAFLNFLGKASIEEVKLGDQVEQEMTIMFTDIRSFTQISEGLSPQENFDFINNYLNRIVPIIQNHGGFIDKYIGDSIMALFPDGAQAAIEAAVLFDSALIQFNEDQIKRGRPSIQVGVGIHTGHLILGTIGHNERLETTVISDAVNIASRVEGLTKYYKSKIIASGEALKQLPHGHELPYRFLDKVQVKGKSKSLDIYEFIPPSDQLKLSYQSAYQEATNAMVAQDAKLAARLFHQILQINPSDGVVQTLLDRCQYFIEHGFPDNWDGTRMMNEK